MVSGQGVCWSLIVWDALIAIDTELKKRRGPGPGAEIGEFFHLSSFYSWPIFLFLSTMKEMVAFMKE